MFENNDGTTPTDPGRPPPPRPLRIIRAELEDLRHDTATPFWVRDLIETALTKDPVDAAAAVAHVSSLLLELADATIRTPLRL